MIRMTGVAALFAALSLSACVLPMRVDKTGEDWKTDDTNGGFIVTTHWEYADGHQVTTVDHVSAGGTTDRRGPPERVVRLFD
jgi:hypothetical protein